MYRKCIESLLQKEGYAHTAYTEINIGLFEQFYDSILTTSSIKKVQ